MNATVALLTTDTTHHRFFAWQLAEHARLDAVFLETAHAVAPFPTTHPFEMQRDAYEREVLLGDHRAPCEDFAAAHTVESINDAEPSLRALAADVVIVFGTGLLHPGLIASAGPECLNLHGGNPEEYRGLDSHLWAIYHGDYPNLVTTLHRIDEQLDNGDIVFQTALPLSATTSLHQLRALNTRACVDLSVLALRSIDSTGTVPARPQVRRGRYYSFMPAVLKDRCVSSFNAYVEGL
jgi:folate-dependent phosphoribosylglycinamide formyltransferase PurN